MLAILGDKIKVSKGEYAGATGVFVGASETPGRGRVALDDGDGRDTVIHEPYDHLTIVRPIISETDKLELEIVRLRIAELRRAVADADVSDTPSIATKVLLDLVPLLDLLPVPESVRKALKNAAADAIQAIGL